MPILDQITGAIDRLIADYLGAADPGKAAILTYILGNTRRNILAIIGRVCTEADGIEKLDDICQALNDAPSITYAPTVLQGAGAANLDQEILAYRQELKWTLLNQELERSLPDDGQKFTPDTIQTLNRPLYQQLRLALQERKGVAVDWGNLGPRLSPALQARFEVKKLSKQERKARIEEDTKETIDDLDLAEAVESLRADPKKLAYYLQLTCELAQEQIDRIVYVSFSGLREAQTETKIERFSREFREELEPLQIFSDVPTETTEHHLRLQVRVPEGTDRLLVRGPWKREIKVGANREMSFDVILNRGEANEVTLLAYNENTNTRSPISTLNVQQTSETTDTDTLLEFLEGLKEGKLREIAEDTGKKEFFQKCLEESTIRHFAGSFDTGRVYVGNLIRRQRNRFVQGILRNTLKLFGRIDAMEFPFLRKGEELMFFQKYCAYKMHQKREAGDKGVILANEPGLGKTINTLAFGHEDELLVVCPNSAVTTWGEEEAKFFENPFLLLLANMKYSRRMEQLARCTRRGIVTNVEFVRHRQEEGGGLDDGQVNGAEPDNRRIRLLNERKFPGRGKVVVIDEAHFLRNASQQTEGIGRLESDFMLLLTASPWRKSAALCRIMHKLLPNDPRFENVKAFEEAFPMYDPQALRTLHMLVRPYVIRFLKEEVLQTTDPNRPLDEQRRTLPAKKYIDPFETRIGLFQLTPAQEEAILLMFTDWQQWVLTYEHYMPRGQLAELDGIRASDDRLSKEHALRQIVNDPRYVNSDEESPKHRAAMEVIEKELAGDNKGVIFCRYHEEIKAYAQLLQAKGIAFVQYTGEIASQGTKKGEDGGEIFYEVDDFSNYILRDGKPVPTEDKARGRTMLALDYERIVFQNNLQIPLMLATYSVGSMSVTFTAAHFLIADDAPRDYIEKYQSEDRIHRIDEGRPKYDVRYYSLVSQYSSEFLERMRTHMTQRKRVGGEAHEEPLEEVSAFDRWFAQGTWDEVQFTNLRAQQTAFRLLNDGIAIDPELIEEEQPFAI